MHKQVTHSTVMALWWMLCCLSIAHAGGNTQVASFTKAKKLAAHVFAGHETTFYCGCTYAGKQIDLASCGYQIKKNAKRAKRLEWEHVVPAHPLARRCPYPNP